MHKFLKTNLLALSFVLLASCGGGGSGSSGSPGGSGGSGGSTSPVGSVSDADAAQNGVSESAPIGTAVGLTANASDPNATDVVTYSLVENAGGFFAIDASSGVVTVAQSLDYETAQAHTIRVRARSSDGSLSEANFGIDVEDDVNELMVALSFPVSNASAIVHYTGTDIDVAGTVLAPSGGAVTVDVFNGVTTTAAAVDIDGSWRATDVPIAQDGGAFVELTVTASNGSGQSNSTTFRISTEVMLQSPLGMASDSANNRIYVLDTRLEALFAIDQTSGDRTIVANALIGSGPRLRWPGKMVIDTGSNQAYVRAGNEFLEVDLATGNRTVLSDASAAMGPIPGSVVAQFGIDISGNRLIAGGDQELIAIDLATGLRTVLSANVRGAGPALGFVTGVVAADNNRALVTNFNKGLYSVNLSTGNRTIISDNATGSGPELKGQMPVAFDSLNNRALIASTEFHGIDVLAVNLSTGARTEFSGDIVGDGPDTSNSQAIEWDATRNRAIVLDELAERLIAVSASSGVRTILSGNSVGNGLFNNGVGPLTTDLDGDNIFYGPTDMTVAKLDLNSGERTTVFDNTGGTGPSFRGTSVLAYDERTDTLYLKTGSGLIALDLATGNRTLASDPPLINGPSMTSIIDMIVDPVSNRILATEASDRFAPTVLAIDLSTGMRVTLSGPANGVGIDLDILGNLVLDPSLNRALVADYGVDALIAVDLTSGDRQVVSDFSMSSPIPLHGVTRVDLLPGSRRLFLLDVNPDNPAVYEHDLVSNTSMTNSDSAKGSGISLNRPTEILVDIEHNRAFVSNNSRSELVIVDLDSGDRVLFSN